MANIFNNISLFNNSCYTFSVEFNMIDYFAIFLYGFSTGLGVVIAQEVYNNLLKDFTGKLFRFIKHFRKKHLF